MNLKEKLAGTYGTVFFVRDMARSVEFYREALDLVPTFESPDWTEIPVPGHTICLHALGNETRSAGSGQNSKLVLKVQGIRDAIAELKQRGVEFSRDLFEVHPGAYSADFLDLDGNCISFYEFERE